jgi:hypothetical protein
MEGGVVVSTCMQRELVRIRTIFDAKGEEASW